MHLMQPMHRRENKRKTTGRRHPHLEVITCMGGHKTPNTKTVTSDADFLISQLQGDYDNDHDSLGERSPPFPTSNATAVEEAAALLSVPAALPVSTSGLLSWLTWVLCIVDRVTS